MISIFLLLAIIVVLLRGSRLPCLYNFVSVLQAHDLVRMPVKFHQRLAFILLELTPKGCLWSYPRDCCHHYSILLGVMYHGQLIIEMLYI